MPRKKKTEDLEAAGAVVNPEQAQAHSETPEERILPASFYELDFNELDRDLSPDQLREWTAIYASFRSKSPLTGTVMGVDRHWLTVTDPETNARAEKEILCLAVMDFRVKVLIPYTEVWNDSMRDMPPHVLWNMAGAKVDYVITSVDRVGGCALASRRMALGFKRNRFMSDRRGHKPGEILTCNIMLAGPKMMLAECNGFDLRLRQRDVSYTAVADLRKEYKPGQEEKAKLMKFDADKGEIAISIKETNPNPFDGADKRHHVGCSRTATITGKYAGGVFCRLPDDTNVLCNYSPGYFDEEFYIGDEVVITIRHFDFVKKQVFGRIRSKLG